MPGIKIQDAFSYINYFFSRYIALLNTSLIFAHHSPQIQFSRVCIDVVPGFTELSEEKRHEVIRLAFAQIEQEIINKFSKTTPQMGAVALISISFIEKNNGQNQAHIYTANIGDHRGYYLIRNKNTLDVKKCERLNVLHTLSNETEKQRVIHAGANVANNRINGEACSTRVLGDYSMKRFLSSEPDIKHHTIPMMDDEEVVVMNIHNRSRISALNLDANNLQGEDTQFIKETSKAIPYYQLPHKFMSLEYNCANSTMIVHRLDLSDVQKNISSPIMTEAVLTGVVNGDSGGYISDYVARNLPVLINTYTENEIGNGQERKENLNSKRAKIFCELQRSTHNQIIEQIYNYRTKKRNIDNILVFFKTAYPIYNFTEVFKEYLTCHSLERGINAHVIVEFEEMLNKMNEVLSAPNKIDFHRHTHFDRFILFKDHSSSWQKLIKELRTHAINWLKRIAELYDDPVLAVQFLQKYRDNPIFSQHRGNHWFQKIGRTATVIDIDKYIVSYLQKIPKVTLVNVN